MAATMSIVLSLSACGGAIQTGRVESTETGIEEIKSTESVEESTEESAEETETESVAETQEPVEDEAVINVKTTSTDKTESADYTYTEDSRTMYAKSTVTVRSLPSTSGSKLGSLSKNQEVAVTGQCNETGWYRIAYGDTEGFVSNKYLIDGTGAVSVAQAGASTDKNTNTSTGDPAIDAAIAQYGPNIMVFDDGTIYSTETWQQVGMLDGTGTVSDIVDGFDRTAAEEVWGYMNAERTAAGLNALVWDENIYNFACSRAQQIVTNFSHEGCGNYGENIYKGWQTTGYDIHMSWYNSPRHHENYMSSRYGSGACAVYVYNGTAYAVENFSLASSSQYTVNQTREYNGETLDLSGAQAEAFDKGNIWVASNGVIVYIESSGNLSANADRGYTMDEVNAALNEYDAMH